MMEHLHFEPGCQYNHHPDRFVLSQQITFDQLDDAACEVENYWRAYILEQFLRADGETGLPVLFRTTTDGGFRFIRSAGVRKALCLHPSTSGKEVRSALLLHPDPLQLASDTLGPTYYTALETLRLLRKPDGDRPWQRIRDELITHRKQGGFASAFDQLSALTDLTSMSACSLTMRNLYLLFSVLHKNRLLLLPFGLWKGIYPGSLTDNRQSYLDNMACPELLGAKGMQDWHAIEATIGAESAGSKVRIRKTLTCLRLTTFDPLRLAMPDRLAETITAYVLHGPFLARGPEMRHASRRNLGRSLHALKQLLIQHGSSEECLFALLSSHRVGSELPSAKSVKRRENQAHPFRFLQQSKHDLSGWPDLLTEYIDAVAISRKVSLISPLKRLCEWLLMFGDGLSSPYRMVRSDIVRTPDSRPTKVLTEYLRERYSADSVVPSTVFAQGRFFCDWLQTRANYEFRNPFNKSEQPSAPTFYGKTDKESLPCRIINLLKDILTEDDWAWAKTIPEDYFWYFKPGSATPERMWAPVRAVALYVLLTIPIRTIQVRLLDSGEFDCEQFDESAWRFVPNANGLKKRRQGVLQPFASTSGGKRERYVGFYINTNKTKGVLPGKRAGYDIQWENRELISHLAHLRKWQQVYNPIDCLLSVNDLSEKSLHAPAKFTNLLPKYAFLFRDASSSRKANREPVTAFRLSALFLQLLAEAEKRLNEADTNIRLITKWEERDEGALAPVEAIVTLHSLRVSGITNFAEAGVPLHILTEFIAGHSTILMDIWYQKFGFSTIHEVIEKASEGMGDAQGLAQLERWIEDSYEANQVRDLNVGDVSPLNELFVAESRRALDSLQRQQPGLWHVDTDGICPNGRTLCEEGGPLIGAAAAAKHTPVPGGAGNCPRCRFWITGPMFLFGQLVKANVAIYEIQEVSDKRRKLADELDALQQTHGTGPDPLKRIATLRAAIEGADSQINNLLETWVARYSYAERSVELMRSSRNQELHQLLQPDAIIGSQQSQAEEDNTESAMEVALVDRHPLDLLEFVAQACEYMPGVSVPSATLRKSKLLDAMLDKEGRSPFFFKLSDEDALRVGNALTRFLSDVSGRQGVSELLAGDTTLASLGLTRQFDAALESVVSKSLPSSSSRPETRILTSNAIQDGC